MRQLVYTRPGRVEWQDAPDPQLTDQGAALIAPLAVARCDLDAPMVTRGLFPGPYPVGHEVAGTVVATGPEVTRHRAGDLVIVPFQISCGHCPPCQAGTFAASAPPTWRPSADRSGSAPWAAATAARWPTCYSSPPPTTCSSPAPAGIQAVVLATLPDNVVDGYRSVGPPLAARPGADVLIVAAAAGSIALYAAAAAVALGAGHVRYLDTDPHRVDAATAFGADAARHDGPWPKRFASVDITVDVTGDADGLATVIRSTARYGHCTSLAIDFNATTPMPLLEMYTRGITFHTSRADSLRYLPDVLKLLATTAFDPLAVPTTIRPWDEAAGAWLQPATKLVIAR